MNGVYNGIPNVNQVTVEESKIGELAVRFDLVMGISRRAPPKTQGRG